MTAPASVSTALVAGAPFLFEGVPCVVTNVGGKTGRTITIEPVPQPDMPAPFSVRILALAEVIYHPVLRVHCHPLRILPPTKVAAAITLPPITDTTAPATHGNGEG